MNLVSSGWDEMGLKANSSGVISAVASNLHRDHCFPTSREDSRRWTSRAMTRVVSLLHASPVFLRVTRMWESEAVGSAGENFLTCCILLRGIVAMVGYFLDLQRCGLEYVHYAVLLQPQRQLQIAVRLLVSEALLIRR